MKLTEAVAIRTKKLLEINGMKQYDLFKLGGIPRPTISSVVGAKKGSIKIDTIYQIASTFGITLSEFFADDIFDKVTD